MRHLTRSAILIAALGTSACGSNDDEGGGGAGGAAPDPAQLGPYPVGVTTIALEDPARPELATTDAADHRRLLTEVWYPAAESARGATRTPFASYFGSAADTILPLLKAAFGATDEAIEAVRNDPTGSVRDADVASEGAFPLVVFSHGNGGLRFQSIFLMEHLASHGYVVVSADHTGNSVVTVVDGKLVLQNGQDGSYTVAQSAIDRVADVSYLVDAASDWNADANGRFAGSIDVTRAGITGHSFGGFTTLAALRDDARFLAGAPLAAGGGMPTELTQPVAHFLAEEDHTVDNALIEANYAALPRPKMLVSVADAGHFSFSNLCLITPENGDGCGAGTRLGSGQPFTFVDDDLVFDVTNYYEAAFFGVHLKGDRRLVAPLAADPYPELATVARDGAP